MNDSYKSEISSVLNDYVKLLDEQKAQVYFYFYFILINLGGDKFLVKLFKELLMMFGV